MADAEEVFRFWVQRLKKNARTTFGPARQTKVLARLKEKSLAEGRGRKDDLKWAIRGCEALPFVGPKGRQAKGGKRHDNLALICQDEENVERFMGYATDHANYVFSRFLEALAARGEVDTMVDFGQPIYVVADCPVCEVEWGLSAMPGTPSFGELLVVKCHVNGCPQDEVLGRLRGLVGERQAA